MLVQQYSISTMTQRCSSMANNTSANDFNDSAIDKNEIFLNSLNYSAITYHNFFLGLCFTDDFKLEILHAVCK